MVERRALCANVLALYIVGATGRHVALPQAAVSTALFFCPCGWFENLGKPLLPCHGR